ncbi:MULTISPECIES: hypothetical protein [Pseudomonadaceae]|uniref:Uncharacterized protein n=1 Tax=Stutzerimonas stutzeri TaxID=316 RepID=A0AA42T918_STUST|nr:hypothetical protein [Stutzerimonas stutzeri]AVX13837.1 hypothetical protein CXB48_14085 [Stutzerimonas stutzeri]MDH1234448.1 hypothetical protein [Stutzerimonas stutzeri]
MNQPLNEFPEQTCTKCGESWPADTEFFFADKGKARGLSHTCKACFEELPSVRAKRAKVQRAPLRSPWENLFPDHRESA